MSILKARRLPRKFRRPVSTQTRQLVQRRYERHRAQRSERWKRLMRKVLERCKNSRRSIAIGLGVLVLFALGIFLAIALFSPAMRIAEVRVVRTESRLDIEQVQHLLSPLFGKHLMLLSSYDVRQLLEEGMADLQHVEVAKDYPSTLVVRIALDPLVARLRILDPGETPSAVSGTGADIDYLTDKGVYISTQRASPEAMLPVFLLTDWGARPSAGTVLISAGLLERMAITEKLLQEQFGQEVLTRTLFLRAQEYHLQTAQWTIWFDMRNSLEDHLQRYRIFLREIPHEEVREYVDLRLKDRVVYR
jgi:hypothetical protein